MSEITEQTWRKLGLVVPPKDADRWDQRPSAPCIIGTNDRYLMYFHGEQYFSDRNKLRRGERPLLELGRPHAPDEHGTGSCAVVRVGDEYWMYYTALYKPNPHWGRISTALAVSTDGGHTFEPHAAGALINIPPRIRHGYSTSSKPFVERNDDRFDVWYSCAVDGQYYRIHYARSDDGLHFASGGNVW